LNLLDLVPALRRHLGHYVNTGETDSQLAAYIADGVEALSFRWSRQYIVTQIPPLSFSVEPTIAPKDKRPIILMASIIYKMGNLQLAGFRDQDFSYDPQQGRQNPLQMDIEELARFLPIYRLARPVTSPLRGYNNVINPESYNWLVI
jgi:hypothetical protein